MSDETRIKILLKQMETCFLVIGKELIKLNRGLEELKKEIKK